MLTTFGEIIGGFLCGCAGGALVWHFKTPFQTWWHGAEATAVKLKADAAAIDAKVQVIKAAISK